MIHRKRRLLPLGRFCGGRLARLFPPADAGDQIFQFDIPARRSARRNGIFAASSQQIIFSEDLTRASRRAGCMGATPPSKHSMRYCQNDLKAEKNSAGV